MLMPWRIKSDRERDQMILAIQRFEGLVLVPTGGRPDDTGGGHAELERDLRSRLIQRITAETDPDRDIWIATGELAEPWFYTLLHAAVDARGAVVDVLLAIRSHSRKEARGYAGFGELLLLAMTLDTMKVGRFTVPIAVDPTWSGLEEAGWVQQDDGVFRRSNVINAGQTV